MTIQEMFNLTSTFLDALTQTEGACLRDVTPQVENLITLQDSMNRLFCYLPMFSPMDCKHCKHTGCNRKRERGVCDEYEV